MPTITKPNDFVNGTDADADEVNENFDQLYTWVNNSAIHKDGTNAFITIPSGPASDPIGANQFTRKAWVDRVAVVPRYVATTTGSKGSTATPASINTTWTTYASYLTTAEADGFTVTKDGLYMVGLNVIYTTHSGGTRRNCALKVNAGDLVAVGNGDPSTATSGFGLPCDAVTVLDLNAGDQVQALYAHDVVPTLGMTVRLWAYGIPGSISA